MLILYTAEAADGEILATAHLAANTPSELCQRASRLMRDIADQSRRKGRVKAEEAAPAPEPAQPYKVGDRIVATWEGSEFYRKGDVAILLRKESGPDWEADFLQPENKVVRGEGKWSIEERHFTLAGAEPAPDAFEEAINKLAENTRQIPAIPVGHGLDATIDALCALNDRVRRLEEGR